jgi:hypothetical protein
MQLPEPALATAPHLMSVDGELRRQIGAQQLPQWHQSPDQLGE